MRLDRLLTLGLIDPLWRTLLHVPAMYRWPFSQSKTFPILMYHSISDGPEPNPSPYYKICTSAFRFNEQMQWLKQLGYRGVTLREGLDALSTQQATHGVQSSEPEKKTPNPNEKLVIISFDDGFRDFHDVAFPILQNYGFSATMYLPTAFICNKRRKFQNHECLTWNEVNFLHQAGIEFGAHTHSHPELVKSSWPEIEDELTKSKSEIESNLGVSVKAFAYPYSYPATRYDFLERFNELLSRAGYESCVTTATSLATSKDNHFELPRLSISSEDDRDLFEAKLRGSHDYMFLLQKFAKKIRS